MNDTAKRRYEMFVRVREFISQRAGEFPQTTRAGELFESLKGLISEADTRATSYAETLRPSAARLAPSR